MFENRDRHARTPAHEVALDCLEAGIAAARPARLVSEAVTAEAETLRVGDSTYDLSRFDRLLLLGGGKAADGLARALADALGDRIDGGSIVTTPKPEDGLDSPATVDVADGTHPVPSEANVAATRRILSLAREAGERTLVVAIVTGGGSALLAAPARDLELSDLERTTSALLESGASIDELNAVRKHLSAIKGGRLALAAAPATVCTLAISDVVGDDPGVIASGPTVPDPTTYADALAVLGRYGLRDRVPDAVVDHLESGAAGNQAETPTETDLDFDATDWHCLANGRTAIEAAREAARDADYRPLVISSAIEGAAAEAGRFHAAVASECAVRGEPIDPPAVLLSGGEVTVSVDGDGTGGPAQELALAAAIDLAEADIDAVLASVDTDGVDGPTDAAGAIVDKTTLADRIPDARDALDRHDAATMLDAESALVRTGPTGTNVNDLRVVVIDD
ncbi:glycerate kinase type-2 family protein [Halovivax limisalsi]|uniref:glycerate kinase type-2 family protein n=1 Tax=Halovivax limisalsi TaxID=1453760 RepID=UPI001FFCF6CA|nr:DUF4147 domain-containing protein [Halovivax limisalsi]